jgi:hypothetical protein
MASAALSRRVEKVVAYPPLCDMDDRQRREFHEALLDADSFEHLPGEVAGGDRQRGAEPAEAAGRQSRFLAGAVPPRRTARASVAVELASPEVALLL